MLVSESKGKLKVGDRVRTNVDGRSCARNKIIEGVVGEITEFRFYVWQNEHDGAKGRLSPGYRGYTYSWKGTFDNKTAAFIEIIASKSDSTPAEGTMSTISSIQKHALSRNFRILRRAGFLNSDLTLTTDGKDELWAIALKENEVELVKRGEKILKRRKAEKKAN